jgi:hypothetical protein
MREPYLHAKPCDSGIRCRNSTQRGGNGSDNKVTDHAEIEKPGSRGGGRCRVNHATEEASDQGVQKAPPEVRAVIEALQVWCGVAQITGIGFSVDTHRDVKKETVGCQLLAERNRPTVTSCVSTRHGY